MDRNFGGVIWTNHALARLRDRDIKQGDAWATWRNPQESKKGSSSGSWIYYRNYGSTQIEVVAKQNEKKEWLILSVWSRPVSQGYGETGGYKKLESVWSLIFKRIFKK